MTDYTDLIARLRKNDPFLHHMMRERPEAADALEAQARRISELEEKLADEEYVSKDTNEMFHEVRDENVGLRARIAELEKNRDGWMVEAQKQIREGFKQTARIAELEAELEAKCKECSDLKIELANWVNYWRDKDNKALQARIAALEAALKPFADMKIAEATQWEGEVSLYGIAARDLRAARAALGEKE